MSGYESLSRALHSQPERVLAAWLEAYSKSPLRLPGAVSEDEVCQWLAPIFEGLVDALAPAQRSDGRQAFPVSSLIGGANELREVEKAAGFLGSRLAVEDVSGFDLAAVFASLREALVPFSDTSRRGELAAFCEWLSVIALDSLGSAKEQALRERSREELEDGTPVVLVAPDILAVFFVGRPPALAVDHVLARAMLRIARVGARDVILDLGGLAEQPDSVILAGIERFLARPKIGETIRVLIAGASIDADSSLQRLADARAEFVLVTPSFESALEEALEHSDFRLVRRR